MSWVLSSGFASNTKHPDGNAKSSSECLKNMAHIKTHSLTLCRIGQAGHELKKHYQCRLLGDGGYIFKLLNKLLYIPVFTQSWGVWGVTCLQVVSAQPIKLPGDLRPVSSWWRHIWPASSRLGHLTLLLLCIGYRCHQSNSLWAEEESWKFFQVQKSWLV